MAAYVPYYALVASPLHALTKKDRAFPTGSKWIPGSDYDLAYHHVKSLILDRPLYLWNKNNGEHLFFEVDSSDDGWGACILKCACPRRRRRRETPPPQQKAQAHHRLDFQSLDNLRKEEPSHLLQRNDSQVANVRTLPQPRRITRPWSRSNLLL